MRPTTTLVNQCIPRTFFGCVSQAYGCNNWDLSNVFSTTYIDDWTIEVNRSSATSAFLSAQQSACTAIHGRGRWEDYSFTIFSPTTDLLPVRIDFFWAPFIALIPSKPWFHTLYSVNLSALIVGSSTWMLYHMQSKAEDPLYDNDAMIGAHHSFINAIATTALGNVTFFRTPAVSERPGNKDSSTINTLPILHSILNAWRNSHPSGLIIDITGLYRTSSGLCGDATFVNDSVSPGYFCHTNLLTYDGTHPNFFVSVLSMKSTLNAVAAQSCHRGPPSACNLIC
jgi:hypothetical protein